MVAFLDGLGGRIGAARRRRGWTRNKLARATGLSPQMVTRYEEGEAEPGAWALKKMLTALDVSPRWALGSMDGGCVNRGAGGER